MWGHSPQSNLLDQCRGILDDTDSSDAVNILLLFPNDPRSVIKTLAELSQHKCPEVRFYIVEENTEVLARHFLLLHTFFDRNVPIRQRAALYLEIFGNALLQEKTAAYVQEKGKALAHLVLDGSPQCGMDNIFDLSLLKQRDLDDLASVFESWNQSKECNFNRDEILRHFYAERYDRFVIVLSTIYHEIY